MLFNIYNKHQECLIKNGFININFLQEDLIDTQDQFDIYAKTFNEDFSIDVEEDTPQHTNKDSLPDRVSDNLCKPIFKRLSKNPAP